jgi:thiamine pyrophosphate-dependent acetolactate synthase large subunit-like protein
MKGYEVIARSLERRSVDVVFGLMGNGNMPFCHAWVDDVGGRYVAAWHEAQAVAMARGYAKATGGPAVATVTHGPGLTNAVTALTACVRGRLPVVLVVPDIARGARGRMQQIDQAAVVAPTGARFIDVTSASGIAAATDEALDVAVAEQTAVVLNVPFPLQQEDVADDAAERRARSSSAGRREYPEPDAEALAIAADLLASAERPLIIAGRGAIPNDARSAIVELAAASGALLGSTLQMRGYFNGEPFNLGSIGGYGSALMTELCGEADVVLALGASLHGRTTNAGSLFAANPKIIHCDVSEQAIGWMTKVDHAVLGDARVVAERLRAELERRGARKEGFRTSAVRDRIRDDDQSKDFEDRSGGGFVDPRSLMIELDKIVPAERSVIMDGGHSTGFSSIFMPSPDDRAYAFGLADYSSIGLGMGMALGVAVGRPDRYPVFFTGDGTLMMTLGDLHSVARHELPMLVVVMNDNAYGSEVHEAHHLGLPTSLSTHESPDFAAVARSLGLEAATAHSLDDVRAAAERAVASRRPFLLDCFINPEVIGSWAEAFHKERSVEPVS